MGSVQNWVGLLREFNLADVADSFKIPAARAGLLRISVLIAISLSYAHFKFRLLPLLALSTQQARVDEH